MPLEIVRHDLTKMKVDAIVNSANSRLKRGGGVSGAIFAAAGADELQAECDSIGFCAVGEAVITGGYALPADKIIHTVGPIWQGGTKNEEQLLASSYTAALDLARRHRLKSIAFPLISSGVFGYPKDLALKTAISAIGAFLLRHEMMVYLVVFDRAAYQLSDRLFAAISSYIDDHYVRERADTAGRANERRQQLKDAADFLVLPAAAVTALPDQPSLDDLISAAGETFTERLLRLIDESGQSDPQIYKRANLDRRLFSKIRGNVDYQPSKSTALALAVALKLDLDQTADLLCRAGYALSPSNRFDLVVRYFIEQGNYDIFAINGALFAFGQSTLGA